MADQPTPDFSQNQQYAPGFQPQQPIPGISSSFPQQQLSPFQQSPQIAQQADMIAVQSMVNSRTTMAIAQQNLMQSMHTAMLGTMGAFSDMSRRGSSMIMSMSPTGRYNDMLAPNQNWALESSFRREVGYGLGNSMGLDPYNSTFSRLMQGRRPEFLTEGEYGSTMRFAGDIRKDQFMKGLGSIGGSAALSATASVLGLGMGASLAVPMVGGLVIDRMLEANFAEREETLKQQMLAKTKRVGIGQQFISTGDSAQITKTFFEQSNPYGSRFFGDTALGRAFKPDVDKHKIFQDVRDSGLLSFESLNADHVIDYVNKISATVEKFSRIGKVTREVATKIMADMKGSGLHGDDLISTFKQTAYTSSLTGIDMQTLGNVISGTSAQAGASGFNNTHAAQSMNNIISGYAMMQQNGMFKGKNVMDLSQREMSYNMQNSRTVLGMVLRKGGVGQLMDFYTKQGGGDTLLGYTLDTYDDNKTVSDKDMQTQVDNLKKEGKGLGEVMNLMSQNYGGDPSMLEKVKLAYYGMGGTDRGAEIDAYVRRGGGESFRSHVGVKEWGYYSNVSGVQASRLVSSSDLADYAATKGMRLGTATGRYNYDKRLGFFNGQGRPVGAAGDAKLDKFHREQAGVYRDMMSKVKDIMGRYSSIDSSNIDDFSVAMAKEFGFDGHKFSNAKWNTALLDGDTAQKVFYGLLESNDPTKFGQLQNIYRSGLNSSGSNASMFSGFLNSLRGNRNIKMPGRVLEGVDSFVSYLSDNSKMQPFIAKLVQLSKASGQSLKDLGAGIEGSLEELGIDTATYKKAIGSSPEKLLSLFEQIEHRGIGSETNKSLFFNGLMDKLGYKGKAGHEAFTKAYKPIEKFAEYFNEDYTVKKTVDAGAFHKDFNKLITIKDPATQKILNKMFDGFYDKKAILSDNSALSENVMNRIGQGLKGTNFAEYDKEALKKSIETLKQEASADPSDKAVENLNKLLGDILQAMNHKDSPKKEGQK